MKHKSATAANTAALSCKETVVSAIGLGGESAEAQGAVSQQLPRLLTFVNLVHVIPVLPESLNF